MKIEICPMCGIAYDDNDLKYRISLYREEPSDHPLSAPKKYCICANCFRSMKDKMETRVEDIRSRIEKYTFDVYNQFELPGEEDQNEEA